MVIEDNPGDARLVKEALSEIGGTRFELHFAERISTGIERLAEGTVDVVLLDLGLPDSAGLDGIARILAESPTTAIVALTGSDDEELARSAVQAGAQDFVAKGAMSAEVLVRTILYAMDRRRLLVEISELQRRLAEAHELRNQLATLVANDLRGAIALICTRADQLIDRWVDVDDVAKFEHVQDISRITKQLAAGLDGVPDVAQAAAGKPPTEVPRA